MARAFVTPWCIQCGRRNLGSTLCCVICATDNLFDFLAEEQLQMTDEEILEDARISGEDVEATHEHVKAILHEALKNCTPVVQSDQRQP